MMYVRPDPVSNRDWVIRERAGMLWAEARHAAENLHLRTFL
jgi:hypothetical protein